MRQPRVLFYVQHLLGIGHLARASRVARALVDDGFDLTLVTGGAPVAGFPGPGIRQVSLPPIIASDQAFSGLADSDGNPVDDAFKARRRDDLLGMLARMRPDIVVLEAYPFGRRQMRFELLPLLEAIAAMAPPPRLVASVRDILQERGKPERDEETAALIERHFDLVMVHGDPAFARLEQTFPLTGRIAAKVAYTGLVAAPPPPPPAERFDVLVSAGGGAAGKKLVATTVGAAVLAGPGLRWALITGPNLPTGDFDAAHAKAPEWLSLFRFRD